MANKLTIQSSGYIRPTHRNGQCQHNIIAPVGNGYGCMYCGALIKDHTGYQAASKSLHGSLSTHNL